jgi:hypothetical protein
MSVYRSSKPAGKASYVRTRRLIWTLAGQGHGIQRPERRPVMEVADGELSAWRRAITNDNGMAWAAGQALSRSSLSVPRDSVPPLPYSGPGFAADAAR